MKNTTKVFIGSSHSFDLEIHTMLLVSMQACMHAVCIHVCVLGCLPMCSHTVAAFTCVISIQLYIIKWCLIILALAGNGSTCTHTCTHV